MTDVALVEKLLARIETHVRELRTLISPGDVLTDLRAERFAEHTLQIAIQAAIDVAGHLVSAHRLGEPETTRELFEKLGRASWLAPEQVDVLQRMTGFRNILVHGYAAVDPRIVHDVLTKRLDDFLGFVAAVRSRLGSP